MHEFFKDGIYYLRRFLFCSPKGEKTFIYWLQCVSFLICCIVVVNIFMWIHLYILIINDCNINLIIKDVAGQSVVLLCEFYGVAFFFHQSEFITMLRLIEGCKIHLPKTTTLKFNQKWNKYPKRIVIFVLSVCIATFCIKIVIFLLNNNSKLDSLCDGTSWLLVPVWIPPVFDPILVGLLISLIQGVLSVFGCSGAIVSFMGQATAIFHIILRIDHIKALMRRVSTSGDPREQKHLIIFCIQYCQCITKIMSSVNGSFRVVNLVFVFSASLVISLHGYLMIMYRSLESAGELITMLTSTTLICLLGQKLEDKANELCFVIYDLPWYEMDTEHRKYLRFMLMHCQKPLLVEGGSLAVFSVELLLKVKVFGKWHEIPRQQVAYGDKGVKYRFSGNTLSAKPWIPPLIGVRDLLKELTGHYYNFVLVNRYRNGNDHIGEHRDNEPELDKYTPIASISLGQTRPFFFRHESSRKKDTSTIKLPTLKFDLEHGSLLLMNPPTNEHWYHSLPPRKNAPGERINLTFRKIKMC